MFRLVICSLFGFALLGVGLAAGPNDFKDFPVKAEVGKEFAYDLAKDHGKAKYTQHSGPKGLTVSSEGEIKWTPTEADIGKHNLIFFNDADKKINISRYKIEVVPPGGAKAAGKTAAPGKTGASKTG